MGLSIFNWSKTPASNATADSAINFREQMAPSQVNDSCRSVMAAIANYRDDVSGTILTDGADTAYTVTTSSGMVDDNTDLFPVVCVAFIPHETNGANPTLNVDSSGALPLRGVTDVALGAGNLIAGTPYVAVLGPDGDEWLIHGYRNDPALVPIGGVIPYWGSVVPSSQWVFPYGQEVSRSTYATLWARAGSPDTGDGNTTFNILDMRGRAIFGQDNMGGSAANRITNSGSGIVGTTLGAAGGAQNVVIAKANLPNYTLEQTLDIANKSGVTHNFQVTENFNADSPGTNVVRTVDFTNSNLAITGGVQSGGSDTPLNKMPPTIILPFILRVL